ncbi:MAG: RDD family protein, partial [Bacteroidota bacterium]
AVVGIVAATLFVLVATRQPARSAPRRVLRFVFVGIGALILFGVVTGITDEARDGSDAPEETDWEEAWLAEEAEIELADSAAAIRAVQAYARALSAGDSLGADTLREEVVPFVAAAELRDLRRSRAESEALDDRNETLEAAAENPGFLDYLWAIAADFGIAIGWLGVYVVLTLTLWNGYTPGKRLVGIRVVRLDGARISLLTAFDRLGGYAAGLVTGLLGFAQVLWDPNRQGVQDKIAGTVVVRMGRHGPRRKT